MSTAATAEAESIQAPSDDAWNETTNDADAPTPDEGYDAIDNDPGEEQPEEEKAEPEKKERTFTQTELDKMIEKRLSRMERRHQREMASLKQSPVQNESPKAEPKSDLAEPKKDNFNSYEEYLEARAEWKAEMRSEKRFRELEEKFEKQAKQREEEEQQKSFSRKADERVKAGQAKYEDFDDVINDAAEDGIIVAGSELHMALIESDIGHDLAYYLSKPENRGEAEDLLELSPRALNRAIGKLEAKLSAANEEKAKPRPRRPTMEPIEGKRNTNMGDPMRDNVSTADFIAMRNKQEYGRRAK